MFTIKGVAYPKKIGNALARLSPKRPDSDVNAAATGANFNCGSFVRFSLSIDIQSRAVADASFSSNGCGFMIAAAGELADHVTRKNLTELHGLAGTELKKHIQTKLGEFPIDRRECVAACIEALSAAFADHRARRIEEFQGEKALICTCFGVSEENIEKLILENSLATVDEITHASKAGSGCGSCRMLIQEMLDCSEIGINFRS